MKLYMIRHGQTEWNKEKRLQGRVDIPVSYTHLNRYPKQIITTNEQGETVHIQEVRHPIEESKYVVCLLYTSLWAALLGANLTR